MLPTPIVTLMQFTNKLVPNKEYIFNIWDHEKKSRVYGDSFFVLKTNSWSYKAISSLSGISLGVIKGYAYGSDELNSYIKNNGNDIKKVQLSHGDSAQEMNIKKLAHGRMGAVVETPAVFWYTANHLKMVDKFKNAGDISKPKNRISPSRLQTPNQRNTPAFFQMALIT